MAVHLTRMKRRAFLSAVGTAASAAMFRLDGATPAVQPKFRIRRELFLPSPKPNVAVLATSYHTRLSGVELLCRHHTMSRSDTSDGAFQRFSSDNGRTWSEAAEVLV